MLALLSVTISLFCISYGEGQSGLQCFSCPNISHPKDCTTIETCAPGQECMTLAKSHDGHVMFEMGCRSKAVCETLSNNPHVIVGRRATTTSCSSCCNNASFCNTMLCSTPTTTLTTDIPTTKHKTPSTTRPTDKLSTTRALGTATTIPTSTPTTSPTTADKLSSLRLGVVPSQQTVDVREMANFECNFDVPVDQPMNMSWSFMNLTGHVTHIYSTAAVHPPEVFIDVKNVSNSDAGVYTCEASTGSHTWTAGGVLKVPDPNTTGVPGNQNTTNWHLQVIPNNQTMAPGDTAIMLCQFDSTVQDPMTMTWTFTAMAGSTRQIYSDVELSPSMTFYVKELAAEDAGVYTCQASYGNETWTAKGSLHVHS